MRLTLTKTTRERPWSTRRPLAGAALVALVLCSAVVAGCGGIDERAAASPPQGLTATIAADHAARTFCGPSTAILRSPRAGSQEVQAKAINDSGDIVGFADAKHGEAPTHAILWKSSGGTVDLGVLPGYVASEAYGINNHRVVFGVVYDKKERTFPFRWEAGHMTLLNGLNGHPQPMDTQSRNSINDRGEMVGTLVLAGQRRAVRWSPAGKATRLPARPGHAWTDVFSINNDGIASGWSRKLASDDGEENPVLWDAAGKVIALKTAPGRADGIAEATNTSGVTVGYLGNLGTDGIPGVANTDPERDNAMVWQSRSAAPRMLGRPAPAHFISELVDVNDHGQAAGTSGTLTKTGFGLAEPRMWRTGWSALRPLPIPAAARASRVTVAAVNDINNRGDIVGNIFGLTARDYSKLSRIDPVLWSCAFGR